MNFWLIFSYWLTRSYHFYYSNFHYDGVSHITGNYFLQKNTNVNLLISIVFPCPLYPLLSFRFDVAAIRHRSASSIPDLGSGIPERLKCVNYVNAFVMADFDRNPASFAVWLKYKPGNEANEENTTNQLLQIELLRLVKFDRSNFYLYRMIVHIIYSSLYASAELNGFDSKNF